MADAAALERARNQVGLSISALWFRYFALGGMRTALELEAVLYGALIGDHHDRDLLTVALNERYAEMGSDQRLPFSDD